MDLPVLMMAVEQEQRDLLEAAVKMAKVSPKDEKKELLNLWMELDPKNHKISFRPFAYEKERSEKQFNYLGKNSAAATQIYAVREGNALEDYGVGKSKGVLMNLLTWQSKRGGQLYEALCECRDAGLFNEEGLNIQCIPNVSPSTGVDVDKKKVIITVGESKFTTEKWLMQLLDMGAKQKIVLIVPVILSQTGRIIVSTHEDYCDAIRRDLSGEKPEEPGKKGKKKQNPEHVCHLCGRSTSDIDTVNYSTKMDRASIGKVFVTTSVNYAYGFDKKNYAKNFALCKDCYMRWKSAERVVMKDYRLRIAGEEAVVLVDGMLEDLDHEDISRIKANVDCAFNPSNLEKWLAELQEDSLELQDIDLYEFNLLFYLSDGKSCSVHKTIEDISGTWFERVTEAFAEIRQHPDYESVLSRNRYSLGSLYHMIPVRTYGTDKKQLIDEVLDIYSRMLQGHAFSWQQIMSYLANALYWGQKEIFASDVSNYSNLHMLRSYHDKVRNKDIRGFEWYVEYMCQAYLAWMEILESLGLVERKEDIIAVETGNVKYDWLKEKEEYLSRHNFSDEAKGMYYVGAMMYQIGVMQYHQGHKDKPILQKVTYSGMSQREIIELLNELHDKIRQYRKAMEAGNRYYLVLKAEVFAERAYQYLGNLPMDKKADEHANLFYLMSGYSSCVSVTKKDGGNSDDADE